MLFTRFAARRSARPFSMLSALLRGQKKRHRRGRLTRLFDRSLIAAEVLEERVLLSVDAFIALDAAGTTTLFVFDDSQVIATANQIQDDSVSVSRTGDLVRISDPLGVFTNGTATNAGPGFAEFDVADFDAIHIDLQEGDDSLTFESTFQSAGITAIDLAGGGPGASDALFLNGAAGAAQTVTIDPDSANPDVTDIVGYVAVSIDSRGYELIVFNGNGGDDTLVVTPGPIGTSRVQNSPTDQRAFITSDTLPVIEWNALNTFRLSHGGTTDTRIDTFVLEDLFDATNFEYAGNNDTLVIEGGPATNDWTIARSGANLEITAATGLGVGALTVVAGLPDQIRFVTAGGNDVLNVDVTGGLIPVPILFDGGDGDDELTVSGDAAATETQYTVGPAVGQGTILHFNAGGGQRIDFTGLEPVNDFVPAPFLVVNATDADNAISYGEGGLGLGEVVIDGFELIQFANKQNLTINARGGSDTINIDATTGTTGLDDITVNGGDPTSGSDTLIFNGEAGVDDDITYTPTGQGAGGISGAGPGIDFSGIEHLAVVGQSADSDALRINGTAGDDTYDVTPGPDPDGGSMTGFRAGAGGFNFVPLTYIGFRNFVSFPTSAGGGTDTLQVNGSSGDDEFVFLDSAVFPGFENIVVNGGTPIFSDAALHVLRGHEGNDQFTLDFDPATDPTPDLRIEGGDSDAATDAVTIIARDAVAENVTIRPDSTNASEQLITGLSNDPVRTSGVELIVYDGRGANDTLIVTPGPVGTSRVQNSPTDQRAFITSDTLPVIEWNALDTFRLSHGGVTDTRIDTFVLEDLFDATNYEYAANNDTLVIEGGPATNNWTIARSGANLEITAATGLGVGALTVLPGFPDQIRFVTAGGNDTLNVDVAGGLINVPILFDGGDGDDVLNISGDAGVTTTTYSVGPALGQGTITHVSGGTTQRIDFTGLEPVVDLVPAATLIVNATNGDNAINYTQGSVAANGLVSIDGFETIEFSNKTELVLNGLAGSDTINLNNPNTPTGLTGITVNGGDPTSGSDTVIVNGTTAADAIVVDQLTAEDSARIVGAQPVTVTVDTAEGLTINGLGGNDDLTFIVPNGNEVNYTPGVLEDAGSISVESSAIGPIQRRLPIDFRDLGAGGSLTVASVAGTRNFDLRVFGTAIDDRFDVDANGRVQVFKRGTGFFVTLPIETPGSDELFLIGLDGDDQFDVDADHPFANGVDVQGGDPSASDVLNFIGSGAGNVTIVLPTQTIIETGSGPVSFTGVEQVNVGAGGGNVTFLGTPGNDQIAVSPTALNAVDVSVVGFNTQFAINNITDFEVDGDLGDNELTVNATSADDTIDVNGTSVVVAGLQEVEFTQIQSLRVFAGSGSDDIDVEASLIPVFIDGGDPIGVLPGDVLEVTGVGPIVPFTGPEKDEGGVQVGANAEVSFDHIETLVLVGPGPALILGTNGDDDITVIARDASTHPVPGVDGIQDFTVSVNDGPDILFVDTPVLLIDALSGDDDIVVREPAPNGAVWDVDIFVAAGPPAAVTGDQGDIVELETPGTQDVTYAPAPAAFAIPALPAGIGLIVPAPGSDTALLTDTTTSSTIAMTTFTLTFLGITIHIGSPGGPEQVVYDGEGGDDNLTVLTPAGADVMNLNPGALIDVGTLDIRQGGGGDTLVPLAFFGLGFNGDLIFADAGGTRVDELTLNGRDLANAGEIFNVDAAGVVNYDEPSSDLVNSLLVLVATPGIANLNLRGLAGDDVFSIAGNHPFTEIFVDGGDPSASDEIDFIGTGGAITIDLAAQTITEAGFGPVSLLGVELADIDANGGDVTVLGTASDDDFTATPATADRVLVTLAGLNLLLDIDEAAALTIDPLAGVDVVNYQGRANNDAIQVTFAATTLIANTGLQTVGLASANTEVLNIFGNGGDDSILLTGDASLIAALGGLITVDGGAGHDFISALGVTDGDLNLLGSAGNDRITGGLGGDLVDGGPGADSLDDGEGGIDVLLGGADSDILTLTSGGLNSADGGDGSDILNIVADVPGNFTIDRADSDATVLGPVGTDFAGAKSIEQINVLSSQNPNYTVRDLTGSSVKSVFLGVELDFQVTPGTGSASLNQNGSTGTVSVDGSPIDDLIGVSLQAHQVSTFTLADAPTVTLGWGKVVLAPTPTYASLTVNGLEGDDNIKAEPGVEAEVPIILDGGVGDDFLSADAILIGGAGNDFLEGGAGDDVFFGNDGEDTMIGLGGADTMDGGAGVDTILIRGTSGNDAISVNQVSATTLVHTVNGDTQLDTLVTVAGVRTVEIARVEAGSGNDTISATWADSLGVDGFVNSLRFDIIGGAATTQDRLGVIDNGVGDLILFRKSQDNSAGSMTIGPANAEPLELTFEEVEFPQPIVGGGGDLVVFKHDPFEFNDARQIATHLGANDVVNFDPTIDPGADPIFGFPADQDFYRVQALTTGTLDFQVFFNEFPTVPSGRPGLPGNGNLNIFVQDIDGTVIAGAGPAFGGNDGGGLNPELNVDGEANQEDERIRIPVVQGQTYFLRVVGATPAAINNYNFTIINEAPPTPFDLELDDVIAGVLLDELQVTTTVDADTFIASPAAAANDDLSTVDDFYVGKLVVFTASAGEEITLERAFVTDYVAATGTFELDREFSRAPEPGDEFQIESIDTGRSQFDNVTRDNTPRIIFRLDDAIFLHDLPGNPADDTPPDEVIPIPFQPGPLQPTLPGYAIAIFDEGPIPPGQNAQIPQVPLGFATQVFTDNNANGVLDAGDTIHEGVYEFTTPVLENGSHFLTARVQMIDPAVPQQTGFGPRSQSLEVVVDTVIPLVFFGDPADPDDGLHPDSDTGVISNVETFDDGVTSDLTPTFVGRAEANTIIQLFLDTDANGIVDNSDVFLGLTVAEPLDGSNQFPGGFWESTSSISLNDPDVLFALGTDDAVVAAVSNTTFSGSAALPAINDEFNGRQLQFTSGNVAGEIVTVLDYIGATRTFITTPLSATPTIGAEFTVAAAKDGLRTILATAEDLAGNLNETPAILEIFIDTQGPQVFDPDGLAGPNQHAVEVNTRNSAGVLVENSIFNIFDIKPTEGPTPRVDGLTINIVDLPERVIPFLDLLALKPDIVTAPGNITLTGDFVGNVAIRDIRVEFDLVSGLPGFPDDGEVAVDGFATAKVFLEFFEPLEDDRYTLTLLDSIVDFAGNALDGESNAAEPNGGPLFRPDQADNVIPDGFSGDGVPGGDFIARFTVDSRPEVGVFGQAGVVVDANGNFGLDALVVGGENYDVSRDLQFNFGIQTDYIFAGGFKPAGAVAVNGYDRIGAYGMLNGQFRFLLDFNDNGKVDAGESILSNRQVNAIPVAGNFDGNPLAPPVGDNATVFDSYDYDPAATDFGNGDEIGLFDGTSWFLDTNGDNLLETTIGGNLRGMPIVGDFDGDGRVDLGAYSATINTFSFSLSSAGGSVINGNSNVTHTFAFGFPGVQERPFAHDFNLDGVTDFGLTVPNQLGTDNELEWYAIVSDFAFNDPASFPVLLNPAANTLALFRPFSPSPLGNDLFFTYGNNEGVPVVGNFDPPIGPNQNAAPPAPPVTNQSVSHNTSTLEIPLPQLDSDGDIIGYNVTLGAAADVLAQMAYQFDQSLNLFYTGNYTENWGGAGEVWMMGSSGWHFITPSGDLYQWNGAKPGAGFLPGSTQVGTLGPIYHEYPELLHDAEPPQPVEPPAGTSVEMLDGHIIHITGATNYLGDLLVLVTGTDGVAETTRSFTVSYTNTLPELHLPPVQHSYSSGSLTVSLPDEDAEGDPLTYAAAVIATDPLMALAYQLDQQLGLRYTGNYTQNWGGANERWLQSASGTWHFITPNGTLYRWTGARAGASFLSGSTVVGTLNASYYTTPAQLYQAPQPTGGSAGGSTVAVVNNELVVTPGPGFTGDLTVAVTVSDGLSERTVEMPVSIVNHAPVLSFLNQTVPHDSGPVTINLPAVDPDGDTVTYTARLESGDPLAQLAYQLDQQLGLRYTGNYSQNWGRANERWLQSASGTWHFITPDGTLYRWTGAASGSGFLSGSTVVATLDGSFHTAPERLYNAPPAAGGNTGGSSVQVNGNQLVVMPGAGFVGQLRVNVTATDGAANTSLAFTVNVTNTGPTLALANQTVVNNSSLTLNLPTTDSDGDVLTYQAQFLGDPQSELAYSLDQQLNLRFTGNYAQNWGGANERWMQAANGTWYFITPDGTLYRWSGSRSGSMFLPGSTVVGQLDNRFWADPTLVHSAQAPQGTSSTSVASVSVSGNRIVVTPVAGATGSIRLRVTASDGQASASQTITVDVRASSQGGAGSFTALDAAFAAWEGID